MKNLFQHKIFTGVLKFALAAGIIAWLLYGIFSDPTKAAQLRQILDGPKDLRLFALAFGLFFIGVVLTFIRWQLLVRALGFPFTTGESLRLGFLGYLFNFVAPGGVGGDIFKAVFVARQFHGRRAQAVATVLLDRIVGLYALLLVASAAIVSKGLLFSETAEVRDIAVITLIATATGAIFVAMMLIPGFTNGRVSRFLGNLPRTGRIFQQLIDAVRLYRLRLGTVAFTFVISIGIHLLSVAGYYSLGKALPGECPTLGEHLIIAPLAMVVGALPITPNGLGTFEFALESLFPIMSQAHVPGSHGLVVSLIYRLITILIAMVGVVLYFLFRRDVVAVLHDAEAPVVSEAASPAGRRS